MMGTTKSALRQMNGVGTVQHVERLPEEESLLLTVDDVARLLKVSVRSVYRLKSAGYLPKATEVLGSTRWRRADIVAWVAAGCPRRENGR